MAEVLDWKKGRKSTPVSPAVAEKRPEDEMIVNPPHHVEEIDNHQRQTSAAPMEETETANPVEQSKPPQAAEAAQRGEAERPMVTGVDSKIVELLREEYERECGT